MSYYGYPPHQFDGTPNKSDRTVWPPNRRDGGFGGGSHGDYTGHGSKRPTGGPSTLPSSAAREIPREDYSYGSISEPIGSKPPKKIGTYERSM